MTASHETFETFKSNSPEETHALGQELAKRLHTGDCLAIVGDLGAGKTAIVRGLATGLGLDDPRMVSSPTYVLVQEYPGRMPIFHLDLYRMTSPAAELADLGLEEMLEEGVVLIEWADRASDALPANHITLKFEIVGENSRTLTLSSNTF